jgi:lipopolysaccharide export system protein LptC
MPTRNTFWSYLIFSVLAILSGWMASYLMPREETTVQANQPGKIDYYSKNVKRTVMGLDGKPKQLLFAARLNHYQEDNHTELSEAVLTLYGRSGPPWIIRSDAALLPAESDTIYLNGNVIITRDSDKTGRTIKIVTRDARVQPDQDYAETSEFIQVLSPPDQLSGKGAQVYFGENLKITVLSNVRRTHESR